MYVYRAVVVSVHDGDTLTLDVDLGFYVRVRQACRVLGVNAAELGTDSGRAARDFLRKLLPAGTALQVTSVHADKYGGRFDGLVLLPNGRDLADVLVEAGHAARWDGTGSKPVPQ